MVQVRLISGVASRLAMLPAIPVPGTIIQFSAPDMEAHGPESRVLDVHFFVDSSVIWVVLEHDFLEREENIEKWGFHHS